MSGLFPENLRKLKEEKGLSQKQLDKLLFVNNSTVASWENGTSGFMVMPLTPERVREQLKKLHYPFQAGGAEA